MKQILSVGLLLGWSMVGCSGGGGAAFDDATGAAHLRLEVACSSNSDCPAAFECEAETDRGVSRCCASIDTVMADGSGAKCPAGYEVEQEHGMLFCKPHGKDGANDDASPDGVGGSDHGAGHDEPVDRGGGASEPQMAEPERPC